MDITSDHIEDHDRGLSHDLPLLQRRNMLKLAGGAGLAAAGLVIAGQGGRAALAQGACSIIPEETAGPYPGDGSNGPNVLDDTGIVRSDIRSSFGTSTTTAQGAPTTVVLTVQNSSCVPVQGLAVYLWHCDREGRYSMYSSGVTNENYLRGVQETDANGKVTFTTIFPACYSGRWPHMHFEVFPSVASAVSSTSAIATSQLAIPQAICDEVYATTGYSQSITNLSRVSLATDGIFRDGVSTQLATVTGSAATGVTLELTMSVNTTAT
jgi:protocatechuate 3,4-dioxygenase beta subunit